MASISESESVLLQLLECPVCLEIMKPPIYLCKVGHSVCKECFEQVQTCPTCQVSYDKLQADTIHGDSLVQFKCFKGCRFTDIHSTNLHLIHEKEASGCEVQCFSCNSVYDVVAYNGELILTETFREMIVAKQARNYSLESMAENVRYPCENSGCIVKVKLGDSTAHEPDCLYRVIGCPKKRCFWKGPLQLFYDHIIGLESTPDISVGGVEHNVISASGDQMWFTVPKIGQRSPRCFIHGDQHIYVFQVMLLPNELLAFSLKHIGTMAATSSICCKVTMLSSISVVICRTATFPVLNYFDLKAKDKVQELGTLSWLKENSFIHKDGEVTFAVDFTVDSDYKGNKPHVKENSTAIRPSLLKYDKKL